MRTWEDNIQAWRQYEHLIDKAYQSPSHARDICLALLSSSPPTDFEQAIECALDEIEDEMEDPHGTHALIR